MSTANSDRTLSFIAFALPTIGLALVLFGLPLVGAALMAAGVVLLLVRGGRIARSIRTAEPSQRVRRLRASAVCAVVFLVSMVGYFVVIWDETASTFGLVITSIPGTFALVGALVLLAAGLLTPRSNEATQSSVA